MISFSSAGLRYALKILLRSCFVRVARLAVSHLSLPAAATRTVPPSHIGRGAWGWLPTAGGSFSYIGVGTGGRHDFVSTMSPTGADWPRFQSSLQSHMIKRLCMVHIMVADERERQDGRCGGRGGGGTHHISSGLGGCIGANSRLSSHHGTANLSGSSGVAVGGGSGSPPPRP